MEMEELDIDIANVCRTCLTIESNMVDIFSLDEQNEMLSYVDILLSYTPLKIQPNDGLPFQICKTCMKQIRGIHTYIQQCIRTDIILHEFVNKIKNRMYKDVLDMHQIECNIKSEKSSEDDAAQYNTEPIQYVSTIAEQKMIENRTSDINKINNLNKPKLYPCKKCDNYFLCWAHLSRHNTSHPRANKICCRFCNKEFIHARHIQPHITAEHLIEIIHVCGYCDEKYCDKLDLENHIIQHKDQVKNEAVVSESGKEGLLLNKIGTELRNHTCEVCNKDFITNSALRRHIVTHDPDKLFNCPQHDCKWSFSTESELSIHINVNHNEEGKAECQYCQKVFKHKRNLRQHMLTHRANKRFICKHCPKGFNHLHHLQNHERIHTKDTPYLCSECGKGFAVKDRLRIHMRRHNNEKPYKCDICDKAFAQSHSLRAHLRTHTGERPYMCSLCGKTFSAKSNLVAHTNNVHNIKEDGSMGSHKHICLVCCEILENADLLAEHMKKHTLRYHCHICKKDFALSTALESHIKTHSAGDRSHVCEECGASFNRSEHLRSHVVRKHTDIKAYKCHMCEKSFAQSCDLNTHIRRHTGEKPYTCQICDRGFAQSNTLTVHMRTHTGEKPYICAICNKGHCSSGALRNHMRVHNKITISESTVSLCK